MGLQHLRVLKTRKFCRGERCEKLLQALWLPLIQPRDFFPAVWIWCVSSLLNMIVGKLALIFILPVSKSLWTVPRCCVADHSAFWWKDKRFWWGLSEFCFRYLKAYSTPTGQNFRKKKLMQHCLIYREKEHMFQANLTGCLKKTYFNWRFGLI